MLLIVNDKTAKGGVGSDSNKSFRAIQVTAIFEISASLHT